MAKRSTTDSNGRDEHGRFVAGNCEAKGNPFARRVAKLRSVMLSAVSEDDMQQIIRKLVSLAKNGDVAAAKAVLDRVFGRAPQAVTVDGERGLIAVHFDMQDSSL